MSPTGAGPVVSVGAVAVQSGSLLLVRRGTSPGSGRWAVPGGRVAPDEPVRAAVVRELREETGLDGEVGSLRGWAEWLGRRHHYVILDFDVTVTGGVLAAGDDAADARWVPLDRVGALELVEGLHEWLVRHGVVPGAGDGQPRRGASG